MKATILTGLVILWPVVSLAADITPLNAKVGLWESTVTTDLGGRAMPAMPQIPPETLAKMPAEQREKLEAMMKGRSGGGVPATVTKVCMTRETLSSGAFANRDSSCTTKVISSTSTKAVVHVECNRSEVKTDGDMTVELTDSEHLKGLMAMKSTVAGQATEMKISFNNKWISSDCGNVKPAVAK